LIFLLLASIMSRSSLVVLSLVITEITKKTYFSNEELLLYNIRNIWKVYFGGLL